MSLSALPPGASHDQDEAHALMQRQIADVLQLDQSSRSSRLQSEELARALMHQAAAIHEAGATDAKDQEAHAAQIRSTLARAYEQTSGQRQCAMPLLHASHSSHTHAVGLLASPGVLAVSGGDSSAPMLDGEARASISAVDAQLGALHESLRRFTHARIEQAAEFRAALPSLAPPPPNAQAWNGPPLRQAALPRAATAQDWMLPQQQPQQQQQQQQLQQQHMAMPFRAPPQPTSDGAMWPAPESAYAAATSVAAEPAWTHPYEAQPSWHRRPVQTASISVVQSPAATLTRSIQPAQPTQPTQQHARTDYSSANANSHSNYEPLSSWPPAHQSATPPLPPQSHSFAQQQQQQQLSHSDAFDPQARQPSRPHFPSAYGSVLTRADVDERPHRDAGTFEPRFTPAPLASYAAHPSLAAPLQNPAAGPALFQQSRAAPMQSSLADHRAEWERMHADAYQREHSRRPSYSDLMKPQQPGPQHPNNASGLGSYWQP